MTWTSSSSAMTDWPGGKVVPRKTLYSLDGPVIFTANVGLIEFLFYKIDEDSAAQFFLVTQTNAAIIEAIISRALSLRGALEQDGYWIVDLSSNGEVRRYWQVRLEDVPPEVLPEHGFAITPMPSSVANTMEQAIAFFSARFTGNDLTTKTIPFLRFKALVDGAYESFRKIFPAPIIGDRSISRSLDFNLLQPKFSSLILAIQEPQIDFEDVKKYLSKEVNSNAITKAFEADRDEFFLRMGEIVGQAQKGEIRKSYAVEHFDTLDQVNDIVPTSSNDLDSVEFRSRTDSKPLAIDERVGDKLRQAYRLAEKAERTIVGAVVEINGESGTFLIKTRLQRLVTCRMDRKVYDNLSLSIGQRIRASGRYTKRSRRDKLEITGGIEDA